MQNSWKTTVLLRYMQASAQAGGMGKEQGCGPALAILAVLQGTEKKQAKAPGESPQDTVLLQGSSSSLSHQAVGDPNIRAIN